MGHALVVEDDADLARMMCTLVAATGFTASSAPRLDEARRLIARQRPDVVLLDLQLPDGSGMSLLQDRDVTAQSHVVLMTGHASLSSSIDALRLGAADYLVKPVDRQQLHSILARFAPVSDALAPGSAQAEGLGGLVGRSPPMREIFSQIERVGPSQATVLITGESGTGKDLAARALHLRSRRAAGPFIAVNCAALSPQLVESELFGHERGSFTGADRQHRGLFEQAHGGTLFLDEITEMPPAVQAKLLRVLESGGFMRVGSTDTRHSDVRIVAASNRDPFVAVEQGLLREDLLYRLNVFGLHMPALRDRADDLPLLVRHLLSAIGQREGEHKTMSDEGMARLRRHAWPGNVRELRNVLQRGWLMSDGAVISERFVYLSGGGSAVSGGLAAGGGGFIGQSLADMERRVILATYAHCGRHRERTAASLGISMKTLYNRLKEYGVG